MLALNWAAGGGGWNGFSKYDSSPRKTWSGAADTGEGSQVGQILEENDSKTDLESMNKHKQKRLLHCLPRRAELVTVMEECALSKLTGLVFHGRADQERGS
jgi:hypothetical protein